MVNMIKEEKHKLIKSIISKIDTTKHWTLDEFFNFIKLFKSTKDKYNYKNDWNAFLKTYKIKHKVPENIMYQLKGKLVPVYKDFKRIYLNPKKEMITTLDEYNNKFTGDKIKLTYKINNMECKYALMILETYKLKRNRQNKISTTFEYLSEYSTKDMSVYSNGKRYVLAIRGVSKNNINPNLSIIDGTLANTNVYQSKVKEFENILKETRRKKSKKLAHLSKWTITGHSLGGTIALMLGQKYKLNVVAFNPELSSNQIKRIKFSRKGVKVIICQGDSMSECLLNCKNLKNVMVVKSNSKNKAINHSLKQIIKGGLFSISEFNLDNLSDKNRNEITKDFQLFLKNIANLDPQNKIQLINKTMEENNDQFNIDLAQVQEDDREEVAQDQNLLGRLYKDQLFKNLKNEISFNPSQTLDTEKESSISEQEEENPTTDIGSLNLSSTPFEINNPIRKLEEKFLGIINSGIATFKKLKQSTDLLKEINDGVRNGLYNKNEVANLKIQLSKFRKQIKQRQEEAKQLAEQRKKKSSIGMMAELANKLKGGPQSKPIKPIKLKTPEIIKPFVFEPGEIDTVSPPIRTEFQVRDFQEEKDPKKILKSFNNDFNQINNANIPILQKLQDFTNLQKQITRVIKNKKLSRSSVKKIRGKITRAKDKINKSKPKKKPKIQLRLDRALNSNSSPSSLRNVPRLSPKFTPIKTTRRNPGLNLSFNSSDLSPPPRSSKRKTRKGPRTITSKRPTNKRLKTLRDLQDLREEKKEEIVEEARRVRALPQQGLFELGRNIQRPQRQEIIAPLQNLKNEAAMNRNNRNFNPMFNAIKAKKKWLKNNKHIKGTKKWRIHEAAFDAEIEEKKKLGKKKSKEIYMNKKKKLKAMKKKQEKSKAKSSKKTPLVVKKKEKEECKCECNCIVQNNSNPIAIEFKDSNKDKGIIYSIDSNPHRKSECLGESIKGKFELIPNFKKDREAIYISGPSGAGKTYFSIQYMKKYLEIYPKRKVYVFARKELDKSLKDYKHSNRIINIKLTNEYFEDMKMKDFKESLIIFDDIENITNDKYLKGKMMDLVNDVLNVGREQKTSIITISHVMLNYKFSRMMILESNKIVMFPKSGNKNQYINFMKRYMGFSKTQIESILRQNSRWIVLDKTCPISMLTQNRLKIMA